MDFRSRAEFFPWFPSSGLGTARFGAISGQTSVPKLELGNQGAETDGFGECLPRLRFALGVGLGRERHPLEG